MPRIFDNIELELLKALSDTIELSQRVDFCIGYFNLRGWRLLDQHVEKWSGGDGQCCRLLVGMQRSAQDELCEYLESIKATGQIDNRTAVTLRRKMAEEFRRQLL